MTTRRTQTLAGRCQSLRARSVGLFLVAALAGLGLGGCGIPGYYAGGSMASQDKYVYESLPDFPQTIILRDIRNGETVWQTDIPVGQQLVLYFFDSQPTDQPDRTTVMRWDMMPVGTQFGDLRNAMPVPGPLHRRLEPMITSKARRVERPAVPAESTGSILQDPEAPGSARPGIIR